ncbi:MAG: ribokinase [Kineosporiaceae bacterium]
MGEVVVVGSLNADLVVYAARLPGDGETVHGTTFARQAGGKGLNQAVASARGGAPTTMVGCVGDDDLGTFLLDQARGGGVDVRGVDAVAGPSGVALISVDASAANRIIVVAGANDRLDAARVTERLHGSAPAVVLCQLETPLSGVAAALRHGRACGAVTVLNPAPASGQPTEVLTDVDWLVPNEHEASLVLGEPVEVADTERALAVARRLQARGPGGVVITLGARGAVAVELDGTEHVLDPFRVTPVDTTAAGDAFCGSFAAALARGASIAEALRRASATGALATTRPGAVPSIPTAAEVDRLIG